MAGSQEPAQGEVSRPTSDRAREQAQHALQVAEAEAQELERLRKSGARTRFINALPLDVRDNFMNRVSEQAKIVNWLVESQRVISIYGRAGVGKTALACKVLADMERASADQRPDGMVYLGAGPNSATEISLDRILDDLGLLLDPTARAAAEQVWRDPKAGDEQKVSTLLDSLQGGRYILLLDNLETHQDAKTYDLTDDGLKAFFNVVLERGGPLSVLVTSRYPLALPNRLRGYEQIVPLEEGLPLGEAIKFLRTLDRDGSLLPDADDDPLLVGMVDTTRGFPRALEAMIGYLRGGRWRSLNDLVADKALLADEVTALIVREAIDQLTPEAVRVLEGLALLGRPAPLSALEYLLAPYMDTTRLRPLLEQLGNAYFVQYNRAVHTFALHPSDRDDCLGRIPAGSPEDVSAAPVSTAQNGGTNGSHPAPPPFTRQTLNERAATFYEHLRKPQTEWKTIDDLAPQLAEFEYRVKAEDYDTAASLLRTFDFDCLLRWGKWQTMLTLHRQLEGKIKDSDLESSCLLSMGTVYYRLGEVQRAIDYSERALTILRAVGDRQGEGAALGNLGLDYASLGETQRAIDYYEQSLEIAREIGDRTTEGIDLLNLGNANADLGNAQQAIEYYEQALVIARETDDQVSEGIVLTCLGNRYADSGDAREAIAYYKQALDITRAIGDRMNEGYVQINLGNRYADVGDDRQALDCYQQALDTAREVGDPVAEGYARLNIGVVQLWAKEYASAINHLAASLEILDRLNNPRGKHFAATWLAQAYLFAGNLTEARHAAEAALPYDVPENTAALLAVYGCILVLPGEREKARLVFETCVSQADNLLSKMPRAYATLYVRALGNAGLALVTGATPGAAHEDYQAALAIFAGKGIVQQELSLLEILVRCPGGEKLQPVVDMLTAALDAGESDADDH